MKLIKIITALIITIIIFTPTSKTDAYGELDVIHEMKITAKTEDDGTVTLEYEFEWEVLDSSSEGPLSWVQIGVANSYFEIIGKSGSARYVKNFGTKYESKVRVDLDRSYFRGDVVKFGFTLKQYNIFPQIEDSYTTSFTPGWFDEINIENMIINWDDNNIESANGTKTSTGYNWSGKVKKGNKFTTVEIKYVPEFVPAEPSEDANFNATYADNTTYNKDEYSSYNNSNNSSDDDGGGFLTTIVGIFTGFIALMLRLFGYKGGSGMGGSSSHSRSSGGGRSCACACAGGGRAGCAKKDFVNSKTRNNKE